MLIFDFVYLITKLPDLLLLMLFEDKGFNGTVLLMLFNVFFVILLLIFLLFILVIF